MDRIAWVDGPWPGKLALAARPRGGEWLHDVLASWQRAGVHTVFSLLTPEEERDLDLTHEERETKGHGVDDADTHTYGEETAPNRVLRVGHFIRAQKGHSS